MPEINLLSRAIDNLKGFFEIDKRFIAIEITEGYVKLAEAQIIKGKRRVLRLIKSPLSSQEDSAISEVLKNLFASFDIARPKVLLSIPRHLVATRFLKLPSTDEEELKDMAKMESLKYLPYTDEDIIYGYRLIEKFEDGYSNVLLAMVQAKAVNRLIDILKSAELDAETISLGSEALFLWHLLAEVDREKKTAMLVNLNSDYIDIDIIEDDKLVFARGAFHRDETPSSGEKALDEIEKSIAAYQKDSAMSIDRIILTGARGHIDKCEELFKERLAAPIEVIDQIMNMPIGEDTDTSPLSDSSFVELLGLSLKSDEVRINLMPENILEGIRFKSYKKNLIFTSALIILVFLSIFGLAAEKLRDKIVYLSTINSELAKIEPEVAKAKKILKDISIIKDGMEKKPLAIDILSEVYKITPQGISLNSLDFESNKSLTLRGNAPALNEAFKYIAGLENSPYFENVKVKYATKRMAANTELADFEINCLLSKVK